MYHTYTQTLRHKAVIMQVYVFFLIILILVTWRYKYYANRERKEKRCLEKIYIFHERALQLSTIFQFFPLFYQILCG